MVRKNTVEMYLTRNEEKSVFAERLIRSLKNRIYKDMTSKSKNVYIDKLDYLIKKYNNTYDRTIKMRPANVKPNTNIDSSKENNDKDPKFKVGDIVRISKYKETFVKGYVPNWSVEVLMIKKVKTIVPWAYY